MFEATVNLDGILEVTIARTIGDSTIARMIRLVTEAQEAKAPSERFSAWFGQRYTVTVLLGAVLAFVVFYWLGRDWEPASYKAATLLVAASPWCDRHIGAGGDPVGALGCGAGRRSVQGRQRARNAGSRRYLRLRQDRSNT